MGGKIHRYLAEDHERLDDALRRATRDPGGINREAYAEFREGLLRHIGIEEKILLPAARAAQGGEPLDIAARLHLDHGALAALLVPNPTHAILSIIRSILERHNSLEEGDDGAYAECERLIGPDIDQVLLRVQNAPRVAVAPHVDSELAMDSARNALRRAGYDLVF